MIAETRQAEQKISLNQGIMTAYRIERLSTTEDLDHIEMQWAKLARSVANMSFFLTWEWGRTWWRHFGDDHELCMLAAWDESGELAGLAPLMIVENKMGLVKIRRLVFLSNGIASPDHMDMLIRPGDEAAAAAILNYLQAKSVGWDVLDLESLASGSIFEMALIDAKMSYYESSRKQVCPYMLLPGSWEAYMSNQLSQKRRRRVRKFSKRFEDEFPRQVDYRRIEEPGEISEAILYISNLSRAYWESKGHASAFSHDRFHAFHTELAIAAHQQGWLRLYQMEVKGEVVACEYNFQYDDVIYGYQGVYNREWANYSPGLVLLAHVFQDSIAQGAREFDFLKGDEEYKFYWTDQARMESRLVYPKTWRGRLWLAAITALDRGIGWAKRSFSKENQDRAAKLLSAIQRKKKPQAD